MQEELHSPTSEVAVAKPSPFTPALITRRDALVARAASIKTVNNAHELEVATLVAREIRTLKADVEEARKRAVAPHVKAQRDYNQAAKDYIAVVEANETSISTLVANFARIEAQRVALENRRRQEELERVERERKQAIAAAEEAARLAAVIAATPEPSPENKEATEAAAQAASMASDLAVAAAIALDDKNEEAAAIAAAPEAQAAHPTGLVNKTVVCWEITDALALFKAWPTFFELRPKNGIINASVSATFVAPGIRVWTEQRANFRKL